MYQPPSAVLVIGDACVDFVVQLPAKGVPLVQRKDPEIHGGGTAANTAVSLARLGTPVSMMGVLGDDGYGRFIRQDLTAMGVQTHLMSIDPDAFTSVVLALIDADGERSVFGWPRRGASFSRLDPAHVTPETLDEIGWLHTSGMCLNEAPTRDAILKGMRLAQAAGIPVSIDLNLRIGLVNGELDPSYKATLLEAIASASYVLGSYSEELRFLAGGSPEEAAGELAGGGHTVIARLGEQGAIAVDSAGQVLASPAFPVAVVDTLGAGDAFDGGFITALLEGADLAEALRWGNAVAALNIGRPGARGLPDRQEVETLLARQS